MMNTLEQTLVQLKCYVMMSAFQQVLVQLKSARVSDKTNGKNIGIIVILTKRISGKVSFTGNKLFNINFPFTFLI